MTIRTPEELRRLKARKKLLEDFEAYAKACIKIKMKPPEDDPEAPVQMGPLVLNRSQRRFMDVAIAQWQRTGRVRIVVLKARQLGLSTLWGAFMYWWTSQRKLQKAIVVTHVATATAELFEMTKRFHDNVPDFVRPSTSRNAGSILQFDQLDSGYRVATAGSDTIGRGSTFQAVHLSEVGLWPSKKAKGLYNGLMQAVPKARDTFVCVESTARGVGNLFHDLWQAAEAGTSGFAPVFIPWIFDTSYQDKLEDIPQPFTRTADEDDLAERCLELYDETITDGQLSWRRKIIATDGIDLFRQEYPTWAEEAFLTSGAPVFHLQNLSDRKKELEAADKDFDAEPRYEVYTFNDGTEPTFTPWHRGALKVYAKPVTGSQYYIGSDVASGSSKDWTVAQVLDADGNQVAVWRGKIDPGQWAHVLATLGRWYNEAQIIIEANNHGILPAARLHEDEGYTNVFTREVYDDLQKEEVLKIGFYTDEKTKPWVIDELVDVIREKTLKLNDLETIQELMTFVNTDAGKQEAEKGCHDDLVMALALVNHIHEPAYVPFEHDLGDYFEMI